MSRRDRKREARAVTVPLLACFVLLLVTLTVWVCAKNWATASAFLRSSGQSVTAFFGRVWHLLPLPVSELLVLFLPLSVTVLLLVSGIRHGWIRLRVVLCRVACAACVLLFVFVCFYGVQYTAPSLASRVGITAEGATVDELYVTAETLVTELNDLAPAVPRDGNGACVFGTYSEQAALVMDAWASLVQELPELSSHPVSSPKHSLLLGKAMSAVNNAGYFFPWTGESVVSADNTPTQIAFNIAHESAHARGVGSEAECNFLAWLACMHGSDVRIRYSGAFNAYIYVGNALYAADPDRWSVLRDQLCDEAKLDLHALNAHLAKYEGPVNDLGTAVNDRFIKVTGQPDGIRSYGLMVDLLVAWNKKASPEE